MAAIHYTSIINSFVSTEGNSALKINYVYYTVLVVYTDGTRHIVEGKLDQIRSYIPFLRTPQDEIQYLTACFQEKTQEVLKEIKSIRDAVDDIKNAEAANLNYILDTLYPIPNVNGMPSEDAVTALKEAGFEPILTNPRVASTNDGKIHSYKRNGKNFKCVDISFEYELPQVDGLSLEDALSIIEYAGFVPNINYVQSESENDGIILHSQRNAKNISELDLDVGIVADPRALQFLSAIEGKDRFSKILTCWKEAKLDGDAKFSDIQSDLESRADIERMYGPSKDPSKIENFIQELKQKLQP